MPHSDEQFLITGALGCIGAWTVRNLLHDGSSVTVFDLASDPRRLRLVLSDDELDRVQFVTGDITDLAALESALDDNQITDKALEKYCKTLVQCNQKKTPKPPPPCVRILNTSPYLNG